MYIVSSYEMIWWHGTSAKKILRIRLAIVIIIVQFYNLTLHRMTVMITFNKIPYFEVRTCVYISRQEIKKRWWRDESYCLSYHIIMTLCFQFLLFFYLYISSHHTSNFFLPSLSLLLILRFVCKKWKRFLCAFFYIS